MRSRHEYLFGERHGGVLTVNSISRKATALACLLALAAISPGLRAHSDIQLQIVQLDARIEAEGPQAELLLKRGDLYRRHGEFGAAQRDFEQARIRVEELRSSVAEAAAELTRVDVNLSRQSVQTVRAPRDGVILRVYAGDVATYVQAGDVVATFVPDNVDRAVELYVDGRDVALVRPGARVRLQFEGWPVVQFSGWSSVAVGTFGGIVTAVDPSAQESGRFRVLVVEDKADPHPWPDERFVRFGSKARGWVLLEEVSVGVELWRRLNNFPAELPGVPAPTGQQ